MGSTETLAEFPLARFRPRKKRSNHKDMVVELAGIFMPRNYLLSQLLGIQLAMKKLSGESRHARHIFRF